MIVTGDTRKIFEAYLDVREDRYVANYARFFGKNYFSGERSFRRNGAVPWYVPKGTEPPEIPIGVAMSKGVFPIGNPYNVRLAMSRYEPNEIYVDEAIIDSFGIDVVKRRFESFCAHHVRPELADLTFGDVIESGFADPSVKVVDEINYTDANDSVAMFFVPICDGSGSCTKTDVDGMAKTLNETMFVCGWCLSATAVLGGFRKTAFADEKGISIAAFSFEKMYNGHEAVLPEALFHVSPIRYLGKIMKRGLVPTSGSTRFSFPPRIYFFKSDELETALKYGVRKCSDVRAAKGSPNVDDGRFVVFVLERSRLEKYPPYKNHKMVFYVDPCYDGRATGGLKGSPAVFTTSNVPISLLGDSAVLCDIADGKADVVGEIALHDAVDTANGM